jgi:hypothetical protein
LDGDIPKAIATGTPITITSHDEHQGMAGVIAHHSRDVFKDALPYLVRFDAGATKWYARKDLQFSQEVPAQRISSLEIAAPPIEARQVVPSAIEANSDADLQGTLQVATEASEDTKKLHDCTILRQGLHQAERARFEVEIAAVPTKVSVAKAKLQRLQNHRKTRCARLSLTTKRMRQWSAS